MVDNEVEAESEIESHPVFTQLWILLMMSPALESTRGARIQS